MIVFFSMDQQYQKYNWLNLVALLISHLFVDGWSDLQLLTIELQCHLHEWDASYKTKEQPRGSPCWWPNPQTARDAQFVLPSVMELGPIFPCMNLVHLIFSKHFLFPLFLQSSCWLGNSLHNIDPASPTSPAIECMQFLAVCM